MLNLSFRGWQMSRLSGSGKPRLEILLHNIRSIQDYVNQLHTQTDQSTRLVNDDNVITATSYWTIMYETHLHNVDKTMTRAFIQRAQSSSKAAHHTKPSLLNKQHVLLLLRLLRQVKHAEYVWDCNDKKIKNSALKIPTSRPRSGGLTKFNGDFLLQRHISIVKCSWKSIQSIASTQTRYIFYIKQAVRDAATICPRPLQVDMIFVFIRQVAPVPPCWLFKTSATSWPLTFWPSKWCPSHVWRGLPLCQF